MQYKIFALTYSDNRVYKFISLKENEQPFDNNCYKIGESENENAHENYSVVDEYGIYNYEIKDGVLFNRSKIEEMNIIKKQKLNERYIPSMQKSFEFALKKLIDLKSMVESEKISISGLYDEWELGEYSVGDIRNHAGQTWECWTAHDNATYPDINPDNPQTWANFWRPLHGKSPETARPWTKPWAGTTDMYHAGEYMVYTDGNTYECVSDTVYSPDEYAQAWRVIGEASEPDGGEGGESGGEEDVQEPSTEEYPAWVQPTGAHDAYAQGAKVSHNGKKWTSDIANNVWEPGVYGWTEVQ